MKDPEFIELLNLYVDREISAQDALRLEAEVVANPKRREVYDQYCRMQKACSMLSDEIAEATPAPEVTIVQFPTQSPWHIGQFALGIAAAAACAVGIVTYKLHDTSRYMPMPDSPVAAVRPVQAPTPLGLVGESDVMKPVFSTRVSAQRVYASDENAAPVAQLNWIGDIQMPPVFTSANSELLINPRTDIKAAALTDAPGQNAPQEPAEMAAFRFQR
jgi:anti-sigma factor RsiW